MAEPAEVLANDEVNKEYRHLVVRCGDVSASAAPGQFFQLLCPQTGGEQPFLRRPMSLYGADPERRQVEFLYKIAGAGTRGLAVLRAGDQLDIMGPLGTGFKLDPSLRHIVAIGRGAGLATLAPLAKAAKANGTSVTAIFSARRPELLVSVDLFRRQGAEVIAVTDSESTSGPANIERILRGLIADGRCEAFFTCGSSRLLRVQQRLAREFDISGPGRHGAANGLRSRTVLLLRARLQRRRRDRSPQGVLGWAGLRHDGGASMIDLSVRVGGLTLANPVMPASGTFAEGLDKAIDFNRLGAFVTKTITRELRAGNPLPRVVERPGGLINSIGIPSKGVPYFLEHTLPYYASYQPPLVVSISAPTAEDFAHLAAELTRPGISAIEANISCPNIEEDGKAFAMRAASTEAVVRQLRAATPLPLWVKLTPNTGDLPEVAQAAEAAGADALVVANTILAMAIDLQTFKPCLGNVMGGLSGPAVKPIVLRQVYQCARTVRIPVIGCGGISTTEDAVEYLLAGATAVQVGTATFVQPAAMTTIIDGLAKFCERREFDRISDLIGAVINEETDEPELAWVAPRS